MELTLFSVGRIIEAPSFELPVVNIGPRQQGRECAANVLQAEGNRESISSALTKALSGEFRKSLKGMKNPYFTGEGSRRIVTTLASLSTSPGLRTKKFQDSESLSSVSFWPPDERLVREE